MTTFQFWAESISSRMSEIGTKLAADFKFVFHMSGSSILLGTGFLIGLRYATIICAGSFLSWWFIVPLLGQFGITQDGILMVLEPRNYIKSYKLYGYRRHCNGRYYWRYQICSGQHLSAWLSNRKNTQNDENAKYYVHKRYSDENHSVWLSYIIH